MKVRYIEIKPNPQTLEFESREKFYEFYSSRIKEIMDYTYPNNLNFYDYFKCEIIHLKKDGMPRKPFNPIWLHSKKAHENQRKNFAIYNEERKKQTIEAGYRRKLAEIDFKIEYWQKQKAELELAHQQEQPNET
jgi:hypothetical protein